MLNRSEMVIVTICISPPPAVPWNARPMMSIFILMATAQMIELRKYDATATRRMIFRPQMSDSLAHIGAAAAFARR